MKKIITILALSIVLFSCSKDDEPISQSQALVKVIDKIDVKTASGNFLPNTNTTRFSYNESKEISKIEYISNGNLEYSYTYTYQNNIPVSSMYEFPGGGDPIYEVTYGYTNNKYASYYDAYYNTTTTFSYNNQFNQYTNTDSNNSYILNQNDDIVSKRLNTFGNEFAYSFDTSKKGPLYNVKNKKFIPILWYGLSSLKTNEITNYPVTAIFDDNLAQNNPFVNTYDTDGFVTKSVFTINNGNQTYEITYTYKSI